VNVIESTKLLFGFNVKPPLKKYLTWKQFISISLCAERSPWCWLRVRKPEQ